MRKGKLLIEEVKTIKPGDRFLDAHSKQFVKVDSIDNSIIIGKNDTDNHVRIHVEDKETLKRIRVQDEVTEEIFELTPSQYRYVFGSANRTFLFFTKDNHIENIPEAIVLSKDLHLEQIVSYIAPVANAYGKYVASQKSIGEPAKNFELWYFEISI